MAERFDVVEIRCGESRGSGFVVGPALVLTAMHVLGRSENGRLALFGSEVRVVAAVNEGTLLRFPACICTEHDIVDFDPELDWVCLRVDVEAFARARVLPLRAVDRDEIGGHWTSYGFPDTAPTEGKACGGNISSTAATLRVRSRSLPALQLYSREAAAASGGAVGGFSGAPVLIGEHAVAMLCAASEDEQGRSLEGTLYAVHLAGVAARLGLGAAAAACPYPGLRPFQESDSDKFYGRDRETSDVVQRIVAGESRILIVGPSGSGKSSLMSAGVLPRLPDRIAVRILRPGDTPGNNLLHAFGDVSTSSVALTELLVRTGAERLLLCIDQLEELFTQGGDSEQRRTFIDRYRELDSDPRCIVIFTLRADFYGDLMESDFWLLLHGRVVHVDLAPLKGASLAEAIEAPARNAGVILEAGLRERLIGDAAAEPGALPLLQVVLAQLWAQQRHGRLLLDDYLALGDEGRTGLAVALERRADAVLHAMSVGEQVMARRILLRLVNLDPGRPSTRRQQAVVHLRASMDDFKDFVRVLEHLTAGRLLTLDRKQRDNETVDVVDLAHESLISAWPALNAWIQQSQVDERQRRMLEGKVDEWKARGSGEGGLLDRVELAEATEWMRRDAARDVGLSDGLLGLVEASREALYRDRRRRRRRIQLSFGALGCFAFVVSLLSVAARQEAARANDLTVQVNRNYSGLLGREGFRELDSGNPERALAYLAAAYEIDPQSLSVRSALRDATRPLDNLLFQVKLSPARTPEVSEAPKPSHPAARAVQAAHFGVEVSDISEAQARAFDLEMRSGVVIDSIRDRNSSVLQPGDLVTRIGGKPIRTDIDFRAAERGLRVGQRVEFEVWRGNHTQALNVVGLGYGGGPLDTEQSKSPQAVRDAELVHEMGSLIAGLAQDHIEGLTGSVNLNHDGSRLVTVDGNNQVALWDVEQRRHVRRLLPANVSTSEHREAHFSNDSHSVLVQVRGSIQSMPATMGEDALIFDASDGRLLAVLERSARCKLVMEAFSRHGRLIGKCKPRSVVEWDASGQRLFEGQSPSPLLEVSADQGMVRFVTVGGELCSLDLGNRLRADCFSSGVLSPDSATFINASFVELSKGTEKYLISFHQPSPIVPIAPQPNSPASKSWRVVSDVSALKLEDAVTRIVLRTFDDARYGDVVALSPEADLVAATVGLRVQLLDAATGAKLADLQQHPSKVGQLAFSGDGKRLVSWSADGTTLVSSVRSRLVDEWSGLTRVVSAEFVNPTATLAIQTSDGRVVLHDPQRHVHDRAIAAVVAEGTAIRVESGTLLTVGATSAKVWGVTNGALLKELPHAGIQGSALRGDLAVTFGGGVLRAWGVSSGILQMELPLKETCRWAILALDGHALLCSTSTGDVLLVELDANGKRVTLPAAPAKARAAFFLSDSAVIGYDNGTLRVIDRQGNIVREFGNDSLLLDLSPASGRSVFVSTWVPSNSQKKLERWGLDTGKLLWVDPTGGTARGRTLDAHSWARMDGKGVSLFDSSGQRLGRFRATAIGFDISLAEYPPLLAVVEDSRVVTWDIAPETRSPVEIKDLARRIPWTLTGGLLEPTEPQTSSRGLGTAERAVFELLPAIDTRKIDAALADYQKLLDALKQAIHSEPSVALRNAVAETELGVAELQIFKQKKFDEAQATVDSVIRRLQNEPSALELTARAQNDLAELCKLLGDKKGALRAYEDTIASYERMARDPAYEVEALLLLFDTHASVKDYMDQVGESSVAQHHLEHATAVAERVGVQRLDPSRRNQRGWYLMLLGEFERARATFLELTKNADPNDVTFRYYLGNFALASLLTGHTEDAFRSYRQGLGSPFAAWFREACLGDLADFRKRGHATPSFATAEGILKKVQ